MIQYIQHRINKTSELASVQKEYGVEIDLRSDVGHLHKLHLSHDAWVLGDDFDNWLLEFKAQCIFGPIILNTKEDGLEDIILQKLKNHKVENEIIFLDTAFPTLIKNVQNGFGDHFFLRVSKFESTSWVHTFKNKIKWVWVDCFNGVPVPIPELKELSKCFKICLVSPELQKQDVNYIDKFQEHLQYAHAVCSKRPDLWKAIEK